MNNHPKLASEESTNESNKFEFVPIAANENKELTIVPFIPFERIKNLEVNPNRELLTKIPENVKLSFNPPK